MKAKQQILQNVANMQQQWQDRHSNALGCSSTQSHPLD